MDEQTLHYMRSRVKEADCLKTRIAELEAKIREVSKSSARVAVPNHNGYFYEVYHLPAEALKIIVAEITTNIKVLQEELAQL